MKCQFTGVFCTRPVGWAAEWAWACFPVQGPPSLWVTAFPIVVIELDPFTASCRPVSRPPAAVFNCLGVLPFACSLPLPTAGRGTVPPCQQAEPEVAWESCSGWDSGCSELKGRPSAQGLCTTLPTPCNVRARALSQVGKKLESTWWLGTLLAQVP